MTAATAEPTRGNLLEPFNILGLVGVLFLVVGTTELATQLFPMVLGSPEWEFGTFSSMMDSLPLFTMGLGFLAAFSIVRPSPILAKVCGTAFVLMALFVLAGAFLYATNVPQALRINPRSTIQTGIKKAISKTALQSTIYPIAFLWAGIFAIRNSSKARR
jgi:hypothetical protein